MIWVLPPTLGGFNDGNRLPQSVIDALAPVGGGRVKEMIENRGRTPVKKRADIPKIFIVLFNYIKQGVEQLAVADVAPLRRPRILPIIPAFVCALR